MLAMRGRAGDNGWRMKTARVMGFVGWLAAWVTGMAGAGASDPVKPEQSGPRPRVGLVLAGGGARGLGHVGVIRLLEELGVQVDCVAGTSMGAIVGGLYAAGYNSREMIAWLEQCDWDELLSDGPARAQRGFRVKAEEQETPRWMEFGIGAAGLKLPNAYLSGQNLLVALRERTAFVGVQRSFDDLPVPFRAIATDVESGAMVVLDRGRLADAMRASMAVPGAFAPFAIDGRLLIDGFASRNLPVSVVRDLGVDVVIAVDVRAELLPAGRLGSPIAMAEQLLSILSQRDTLEQIRTLSSHDVLVRLKLPGYFSSSFRDALAIAQLGYEEAGEARAALAALSLPAAEYARRETARRRLRRELPVIAGIEVEGVARGAETVVRRRLDLATGERLDAARLRSGLGRVHDLGYFRRVDYRIDERPGGAVLVVSTEPKPWGPNFLQFGIGLGSDLDGDSELNVRTSLRFTQLNRQGGELAVRTSLGEIDRLDAEFFQPLGRTSAFFLAPGFEVLRQPEFFSADLRSLVPDARLLELRFQRQTAFAGAAGGIRLGVDGEFRAGVRRGSVRYSQIRTPPILVVGPEGNVAVLDLARDLRDYTASVGFAQLTLDRLDHLFFPRHGAFLQTRIEREFGRRGVTTAGGTLTLPMAFGRTVFQPRLAVDYTLEREGGVERLPFRVGGLFQLSGLPDDEVYGLNRFVGALVVRRGIGGTLRRPAYYLGGSIEGGNTWNTFNRLVPAEWLAAGSVFVATDTLLGPVHLALGKAERHAPTIYFYLGRVLP